jgi:hypothetical protein
VQWSDFSDVFRVAFEESLLNFRDLHYGKFLCRSKACIVRNFYVVWRTVQWQNFSEVCRVIFEESLINFIGLHYGKFLCSLEDCAMAKF